MKNRKKKFEDWSRRSIIPIRGVRERKKEERKGKNEKNHSTSFKKIIPGLKRWFQVERSGQVLSIINEERPTLEHSCCKISELWKQVQSLELSEISIMRKEGRRANKREKKKRKTKHIQVTHYT